MAYAMAKVVALLCVALLVAHVDCARLLKEASDDTTGMVASTFSTETTEDAPKFADIQDLGGQDFQAEEASEFETVPAPDAEYNYSKDSVEASGAFADEGFLVPTPPSGDAFADEGFLVPPAVDTDSATSFAHERYVVNDEGPDASSEESQPYQFNAESQDQAEAEPVYPQGSDSGSTELTSLAVEQPSFAFESINPGAYGEQKSDEPAGVFEFESHDQQSDP